MILIGQYNSPFVRRVAVALNLLGLGYEHRPWSTFGDAERLAAFNPLRRVPTLVLDNGEVLLETIAILDHLDEQVGEARALLPARGASRRAALRTCVLASGLSDKMVALVYERVLHDTPSEAWVERCATQIGSALTSLERECADRARPYWAGGAPGHADIAVACAMRFLGEAHAELRARHDLPALQNHADRCEALSAFGSVVQAFDPPKA